MTSPLPNSTSSTESGNGNSLVGQYAPKGPFDEMVDAAGQLRPAWQRLAAALDGFGAAGLAQRNEQVRRLLRENGVTYNTYGAPSGPDRPWELDPLPLLFDTREWRALADGLAQRAHLLDRLAADVYGPQTLLHRGLLPPELVYGHSGFLNACHGLKPSQDIFLHLYAAHLARDADGRWLVLADRTQGPSGATYAIENRIVISRTLPDEFHNLYVERLASFFMQLRESLWSLSPRPVDNPRVVVLTPGAKSATYFEDSYQARYLGFTLVEGNDLTVRGTSVFLKTLGGLLPVDVILRRLADEDCDPLELKPDSWQGVPGLVQAVRSGQVSVANALGSGWLEAPALMAFLPEICRQLLGEPLRLPSVTTWWCGRADDMRYVEEHFDKLVIRPATQHRAAKPIVCSELSKGDRAMLLDRVRTTPQHFSAQAHVARSTAPVWNNGAMQSWHVGLRAFAVTTGEGYQVMPGGLSRVSSSLTSLGESMAAGQGSKDVWVLSDQPVAPVTLLNRQGPAVELQRTGNDLPSRVAENVFWLGRQVERVEGVVRHLRSIVVRLTSELEIEKRPELWLLIQALVHPGDNFALAPPPPPGSAYETMQDLSRRWLFDAQTVGTVAHTLVAVKRVASTLRDRLSVDTWRIINQLDIDVLFPWQTDKARLGDLLLLLNQLLSTLLGISGLANENMTRGPGWRFLEIGRRIERAGNLLRLLQRTLVQPSDDLVPLLEVLLEIGDSTMTYRNRYLTSLQLSPTLDLLVMDETNPRAVAFQIKSLIEHVQELRVAGGRRRERVERDLAFDAQRTLRLVDADGLGELDARGVRSLLQGFLGSLTARLEALSDHITAAYFTHAAASHQLSGPAAGGPS
jgi:uncharacterized circularly permuted ATP-grasp superfamily protein/uncharacterized alpha-E superfamily protein